MVLGLGYILAFNNPANPLEVLYGTFVILAICNVYHYHAQGYLIATTSLNQISRCSTKLPRRWAVVFCARSGR
jgi:iron(III) transport system permease protein